jgi:IS1 family transposase
MTGVHRDTILRLMVRAGQGCDRVLDDLMRDLPCQRLQIDELWGYIGKKERHLKPDDDRSRLGDIWTFVALDADSKIVPCYRVGRRDKPTATAFLTDLSSRLKNRIQLSADALDAYVDASIEAFGLEEVDFGQIVKSYEAEPIGPGRYSPPHVTAVHRNRVSGNPDPKHISTSYVERQNLSLRMGIRRLTRLTNAFSRKLENFEAHMGLWFGYYNLVRIHLTLRCTPAMEAGVLPSVWTMGDLLDAALGN